MATTISTQDIVDAKRDIEDIGKAVNEKTIVSPRYGDDFKSLPMIADEGEAAIGSFESTAQEKVNEWDSAINLITQEGGVPALAVSTAGGENQQDINDYNGVKWRNKAGGYDSNARVMLDNGDIVISTIDGNTNNPNSDITGWEFEQNEIPVNCVADLQTTPAKTGRVANVKSFYLGIEKGAGTYIFESSKVAQHDGVINQWGWILQSETLEITQGGAYCDGVHDDSAAIQNTLNAAFSTGRKVVDAPKDSVSIRLDNPITIPEGVWLRGVESKVVDNLKKITPILKVYYGKGTSNDLIKLRRGSQFTGFAFDYPEQVNKDMIDPLTSTEKATPFEYGYAVNLDNAYYSGANVDSPVVRCIYIGNAYRGINMDGTGKFIIEDIYGQPLYKGIRLDHVMDVSRMNNTHFWTYHAYVGTKLYNWIKANGTAYELMRGDAIQRYAVFAYGYYKGTAYLRSPRDGGTWWGEEFGTTMDVCTIPFYFEAANRVMFYGGAGTTAVLNRPSVITKDDANNSEINVNFTGTALTGGSAIAAILDHTNGKMVFDNANFGIKPTSSETAGRGFTCTPIINNKNAEVWINEFNLDIDTLAVDFKTRINNIEPPKFLSTITPAQSASDWISSAPANTTVTNAGADGVLIQKSTVGGGVNVQLPLTVDYYGIAFIEFSFKQTTNNAAFNMNYVNVGLDAVRDLLLGGINGAGATADFIRVVKPVFISKRTGALFLTINNYSSNPAGCYIKDVKVHTLQNVSNEFCSLVLNKYYKVKSNAEYEAVEYFGKSQQNKRLYGTAAPSFTTGFIKGDEIINTNITTGQPKGWVFTGTAFISMGNY